ncbi:MAG: c-type cytochrome [Thermomicrobiales bacterium]|nr:c-type cytochrome [Thermomicrobiales bacterium]
MLRGLRIPRRTLIRVLVLTVLLSGAVSGLIAAQADPASQGQALFEQKCVGCHTVGGGPLVGPDLQGVTSQRDHDWLVKWISDPTSMVNAKDPTALALVEQYPALVMPSLGLSQTEIDEVLAYLASASGASASGTPGSGAATPAATPAVLGDVSRGHSLFTGRSQFAGGGPSCIACHSVSGIGTLGGGQLGPDLTQSVQKYGGPAGLSAFLSNPPTKTMSMVWGTRPFTPQERADLVAYLESVAVTGRATNSIVKLSALALGGTVVLLLIVHLIWRGRLLGVRRQMIRRTLVSGKGR